MKIEKIVIRVLPWSACSKSFFGISDQFTGREVARDSYSQVSPGPDKARAEIAEVETGPTEAATISGFDERSSFDDPVEEIPTATVMLAEEDRVRLRRVHLALIKAKLPMIPQEFALAESDVDAFRAWVDGAEKC